MPHFIQKSTKQGARWIGKVYNPHTKKYVYTHSWPLKREAQREADEIRRRILLGEEPKPEQVLINAYVADFLLTIGHLAKSTRDDYQYTCAKIVAYFEDAPLASITTRDCERFLDARYAAGDSKYTARKVLTRLRQIMRRAVRDGIISRSPADNVTNAPRGDLRQKEIVVLSREQVRQFIDLAPEEAKTLFTVWFASGLRFGEIAGLTWGALDWDNNLLLIRSQIQDGKLLPYLKSRTSRRAIPLSPDIMKMLVTHHESCPRSDYGLVFPTKQGKPLHRSNIHRLFAPIVKEMGLERFTPHCIRHTYTTLLLSNAVSPKAIAVLLGHSPGSGDLIMSTYGHLLASDTERAVATMSDIVVREDLAVGEVIYLDVKQWRLCSASGTMYQRESTFRGTVSQEAVAIQLPTLDASQSGADKQLSDQRNCTKRPRSSGDRAQVS